MKNCSDFTGSGPSSYTIVPSTDSCTSDLLEIRGDGTEPDNFVSHELSDRFLTWLGGSGDCWISFGDERNETTTWDLSDPRITVEVPAGVRYRLGCIGVNWFRSEIRLHRTALEETAIPGADLQIHRPDQIRPALAGADVGYVPGPALNALARLEAAAMQYPTTTINRS